MPRLRVLMRFRESNKEVPRRPCYCGISMNRVPRGRVWFAGFLLLGVLLGATITELLGRVFELSLHITATYVVLALTVSTIVGVASGWYPASRAAKLDPVVALRAE